VEGDHVKDLNRDPGLGVSEEDFSVQDDVDVVWFRWGFGVGVKVDGGSG
jgi:hypothetical protein